MSHPAHAYRQFSVQGSTPVGLVVMLYDGVIAALRRAATAILAHEIQNKCTELNRALAIIVQLEGTLNFERGGEVAQTLKAFYVYARAQVLQGNVQNSAEIFQALIEKFDSVRDAWHQADHPSPPSTAAAPDDESPPPTPPAPSSGPWRLAV